MMLGIAFFFLGENMAQLELSFSALLVVALLGIEVKDMLPKNVTGHLAMHAFGHALMFPNAVYSFSAYTQKAFISAHTYSDQNPEGIRVLYFPDGSKPCQGQCAGKHAWKDALEKDPEIDMVPIKISMNVVFPQPSDFRFSWDWHKQLENSKFLSDSLTHG